MENKRIAKLFRPVVLVWAITNILIGVGAPLWDSLKVDYRVLIGGNTLLLLVTIVSFILYLRGLRNNNMHAFVRVMYGSLLAKFFLCLVAVLIYASMTRKEMNRNGILGCCILYLLYSFLEVRILLTLSRKPSNNV